MENCPWIVVLIYSVLHPFMMAKYAFMKTRFYKPKFKKGDRVYNRYDYGTPTAVTLDSYIGPYIGWGMTMYPDRWFRVVEEGWNAHAALDVNGHVAVGYHWLPYLPEDE